MGPRNSSPKSRPESGWATAITIATIGKASPSRISQPLDTKRRSRSGLVWAASEMSGKSAPTIAIGTICTWSTSFCAAA